MKKSSSTVWILGAYGNGNIGDDMLGDLVRRTLERHGLEAETFAGDFFPFPRTSAHGRKAIFRRVKRGDVLLIAGGGLLNDHFGLGFLKLFASVVLVCRLRGAKVIFSGIGVEGFRTWKGRLLARLAVTGANAVSVRDRPSAIHVADVGGKAAVIPDLGWLARTHLPNAVATGGRNAVVFSVAIENESKRVEREATVREAASRVLQETNHDVILVAMQSSQVAALDDEVSLERIRTSLSSERVSLFRPTHYVDLYPVLQGASVVAGYRLHAAVLAVVAGCRVVAVSRSHKVREALAGLPQCRILDEDDSDGDLTEQFASAIVEAAKYPPVELRDLEQLDNYCIEVETDLIGAAGGRN